MKLCRPQNHLRKKYPYGHFAIASAWFARDLVNLFSDHHVFLFSQDDKARVPLRLPISKKQTDILMYSKYKVILPNHDFPIRTKHKLVPLVYATCLKKDGKVSHNGSTFISVRSGKHDKSCTATHSEDIEIIFQPKEKLLETGK